MRIPSVITFLALVVCVNLAAADATNAPVSPPAKSGFIWYLDVDATNAPVGQMAMQQLVFVKSFALGGVGLVGATSPGEIAYRMIVTNTNALDLFGKVQFYGTTEAQLYVLCGIRQLAPKNFDAWAKPIIAANEKVSMMTGCFIYESRASIVVSRIKDGFYDTYLTAEPRKPNLHPVPAVPRRKPGSL